jgi:hypothetical protein
MERATLPRRDGRINVWQSLIRPLIYGSGNLTTKRPAPIVRRKADIGGTFGIT